MEKKTKKKFDPFDQVYEFINYKMPEGTRDMSFQSEEDIKEVEDRYRHLSEFGAKFTLNQLENYLTKLYDLTDKNNRMDLKLNPEKENL